MTTGLASTLNTITSAVTTFLGDAWPVLIGICIVLLLVMVVFRFGLGAVKHFIRFGRA